MSLHAETLRHWEAVYIRFRHDLESFEPKTELPLTETSKEQTDRKFCSHLYIMQTFSQPCMPATKHSKVEFKTM